MAFPAVLVGEVAELLARAYVLASARGRLTTFTPDADVDVRHPTAPKPGVVRGALSSKSNPDERSRFLSFRIPRSSID
jgi:hypothetical protein